MFALSRKALGRCVNKAVPVSLVGIFNYDGAQVRFSSHKSLTRWMLHELSFKVKDNKIKKYFLKLMTLCFLQDHYHKMIELSSEARTAYEVMVSSLEQSDQAEAEQAVNSEEELQISSMAEEAEPSPESTHPEDPEYCKLLFIQCDPRR